VAENATKKSVKDAHGQKPEDHGMHDLDVEDRHPHRHGYAFISVAV
jgi:hypothetical protein